MKKSAPIAVIFMLLLLAITYVFAKFQGGFVSWFLFYTLLPIMLFSFVQYLIGLAGVRVERSIGEKRRTAGQNMEVTLRLSRRFLFPLFFIVVTDHMDNKLSQRAQQRGILLFLGLKKELAMSYTLEQIPRGVYQWKEVTLQTGDPFGLIRKEKIIPLYDEVVVYPSFQDVFSWRTMNEKNMGVHDARVIHMNEDITSVVGVRDYVPGDRLSQIHWKTTARTGQLKTKEFEQQITNEFMFFLNRERIRSGNDEIQFERAVSLIASLIKFTLRQHYATGLVSHGDIESATLQISKDQNHLFRVFEHLARIRQDAKVPFYQTVLQEVSYLTRGTTIVIVSTQLLKQLTMLMGDLSYRKYKIEFFWVKHKQDMTADERQHLKLLESMQVRYYIVTTDRFNDLLAGGEHHVSAI
jgi:uncharacterized protein (DUF58 family)